MDKREAAKALSATVRTINNWIRRGMPTASIKEARAWKKKFISDKPRKGGKLPGAGRKKRDRGQVEGTGKKRSETARERDSEPGLEAGEDGSRQMTFDEIKTRRERIAAIRAGRATKAEIQYTDDETRALERTDAYEVKHARLLDAREVQREWTRGLQAVRDNLSGIPAAAARDAAVELALSQEQEMRLREMLEKRQARAFAAISQNAELGAGNAE